VEEHKVPHKAMVTLAALLLLLASCADFSLYGVMKGQIPGGTLQISPVAATLVVSTTCVFSASGGSPPYSFAVVGSGSIVKNSENSGLYTAPGTPGSDIIQVQDSQGATSQATATILIN
jgi:hypothetical protein